MIALSISLTLLSLAGLPQERVVYVPGWHRCARGEDEALRFVATAFPEAEVSAYEWDGNCAWRKARGNADDADIVDFASATAEPVEIVCNEGDTMLKFGYRPFGGEKSAALGAVGVAAPFANCRVSFVSPETVASAPVAGLWAKVGLFRSLAAHYAPFYLEHFKQLSDKRRVQ